MEPRTCAARKDSAVHVSLSSYSPFKQPGASHPPPWTRQRACEAAATDVESVTNHRKSEELRRHAFPPSGGAPCVGYICSTAGYCQPAILEFFITSSSTTAGAFGVVRTVACGSQSPIFSPWSSNPRSSNPRSSNPGLFNPGLGEDP